MTIWRLFLQEILYRRWSFLLAVLSVVVAAGCLTAELTVLSLHDTATTHLLAAKENETNVRIQAEETKTKARLAKFEAGTKTRLAEEEAKTKERLRKLEDDYRKITKKLDFNILIVSDKENMPLMDKRKVATELMPEDYVHQLADKIVTMQHLLPMVQEEVDWPGLDGKVILNGVRGEVPLLHGDEKKPLLQPVPKGTVVLGHYVHKLLGLSKGDKVTFKGKQFNVHELHGYRGESKDDWTVWMNLEEAQALLNRKGKINVILALECNCAAEDRLAEVRAEVKKILPHTEVLEVATKALVRAEARERAKKEAKDALAQTVAAAKAALAQEKTQANATLAQETARATDELQQVAATREQMRAQLSGFAALLVPLVLLGCIVWLGVMSLNNVRERQGEIGILRALGLTSGKIFTLFVSRAVVVGLIGAALGYALGVLAGGAWADSEAAGVESIFDPLLLVIVLLAGPALCAVVGGLAALAAVKQDPAVVLQQV